MRRQIITAALVLFLTGSGLVLDTRAAGTCSLQTLRGNYGFQVTGLALGGTPLAGVALITFDGAGSYTGKDSTSFGGFFSEGTLTGTYTVNDDCTGTTTTTFPNGFVVTSNIVIVDNGKEILMVISNQGEVGSGTLKRQ